jgi:hypothetical protein
MDQLDVHKGQSIMPPQLLHHGPWLGLKILQGYIIHKDLGFMRTQIMLACFQTIHYCKQLVSIGLLLTFYFQRWLCVLLTSRPCLLQRPFAFMCISKNFTKFGNRSFSVDDNFLFKRSNTLYCSPFHSNEPSFFKRSMSGLANTKKSFMNFL